jgi:hypothetical protein
MVFFYNCFKKGENWVIIEAKLSKKLKMKHEDNLHLWEIFNSL